MEKMMAQIHNDINREAAEKGKPVDEDELTKRIQDFLNSKGAKMNRLNNSIEITEHIKEMSKATTLEEVNVILKKKNPTGAFAFFTAPRARAVYVARRARTARVATGATRVSRSARGKKRLTSVKRLRRSKRLAEKRRDEELKEIKNAAETKKKVAKKETVKKAPATRKRAKAVEVEPEEPVPEESEPEEPKPVKSKSKAKPKAEPKTKVDTITEEPKADLKRKEPPSEGITEEEARRLAKKTIARSKSK